MPSRVPPVQKPLLGGGGGGKYSSGSSGYVRLSSRDDECEPLAINWSAGGSHGGTAAAAANGNTTYVAPPRYDTSLQSDESETEFEMSQLRGGTPAAAAGSLSNRRNRSQGCLSAGGEPALPSLSSLSAGGGGSGSGDRQQLLARPGGSSYTSGRHPSSCKMLYLEKEVQSTDTLASIALHYRCPVAELKRVNKLIQDVDFYALRRIKIPVKPHSTLSELISLPGAGGAAVEGSDWPVGEAESANGVAGDVSGSSSGGSGSSPSSTIEEGDLVRTVSIGELCDGRSASRSGHATTRTSPNTFLRHMDQDLERIRQQGTATGQHSLKGSLEEATHSLTQTTFHPLVGGSAAAESGVRRHDGAACGMSWWGALALVLLVGLVVPLAYYWYYEYHTHHTADTAQHSS